MLSVSMLHWPNRSLDLNIMENTWAMIEYGVYDGPQPYIIQELEKTYGVIIKNKLCIVNIKF